MGRTMFEPDVGTVLTTSCTQAATEMAEPKSMRRTNVVHTCT